MSQLSRYAAGIRASALSFFREPLNLALLVALPAASIHIFGVAYGQFPEFGFLNLSASLGTTVRITGATFATGMLAGVLGLFQLISARDADFRLSICGFPALDLLVSRLVTLVVISLVIAGVSTLTLVGLLSEPVASPQFVFAGLTLVGVIYAMVGLLVGTVLPRALEGSLALVILADMDNVIASGIFPIQGRITQLSPTSYAHDVVTRAVIDGGLATGAVLPSMTMVVALGSLAVLAYMHTVEPVASGGCHPLNTRVTTAVTMGLREFRRTPVLIGLLIVLPLYFIGGFMTIVPDATLTVPISGEPVTVTLSAFVAALVTPVTAGLLSGIVGLFLMQSSKAADDRLRLAGYRSRELIVSRVSLLAAGGVLVSAVSLAIVLVGFTPRSIPAFVAATVLTALIYGILGVVIGVSLNRLAGVYVMLFAPFVDMLLFQSPIATDSATWTKVLLGYFTTKATMDAAFTQGLDSWNFIGATVYFISVLTIGIIVFHQVTAVE